MPDKKLALVFIGGVILNLVGSSFAEVFNFKIYLDTIGTIFIAAVGGYAPGIAVGLFTNLLKAMSEPTNMYFCSVNVFVAIVTVFFARKDYLGNFQGQP